MQYEEELVVLGLAFEVVEVKTGERWDIAGRGGEWRILICLSFQVLNHYNSICINDRTKRNPNSMFIMQR